MSDSLAFTKDKNQVATPWHIVEFLSELLNTENKRVLDPTAGNGAMLTHAVEKYGIELDEKPYKMLCERYPEGHFLNASLFESAEWIKEQKPEVILMNPPFNADKTKGLEFVRFTADTVGSGMLAAIVPSGIIGRPKGLLVNTKKQLLERHSLKAVFSFNNDLFYPAASVGVVCLIFELGKPNADKTWFAVFEDDGLEKDRKKGRIDKAGKWNEVKSLWLDMFKEKPEHMIANEENLIPCESKLITAEDDWNPKSQIKRDPKSLIPTDEDFEKVVNEYMDFKIKQVGLEKFLEDNPHLLPPKEKRIEILEKRIADLQKQLEELKNS